MNNLYHLSEFPGVKYRRLGSEKKKGQVRITIQKVGTGEITEVSERTFKSDFVKEKEAQ